MTDDRYYKTNDRHLAAYLFSTGASLAGVQASDSEVVFSFLASLDLYHRVNIFESGKNAFVDVRLYAQSLDKLDDEVREQLMESHAQENQ